jgi:hypothetical protein
METRGFEPSNTKGDFFPVAPPADDVTVYYHATSRLFSPIIEEQGFLPEFRFVSDEELAVLQKHAHRFVVSCNGSQFLPA